MVKRILDATRTDFEKMSSRDLLDSIRAAEGRTIISEIVGMSLPLINGISNPELAVTFSADMVILNGYDVWNPVVMGVPSSKGEEKKETIFGIRIPPGRGATIADVKRLIGRPVGINLEPIDPEAQVIGGAIQIPRGRQASVESVKEAIKQEVDFIILTGNPRTGVTNRSIKKSIEEIRKAVGDKVVLFAGKMHAAGVAGEAGAEITTPEIIKGFVDAGCDGILVPAPATVPGMTVETVSKLVDAAHKHEILAVSCIGTSQEGADLDTIRRIALNSKMAGVDIHHIGDAGYSGMALPENIMAYSIAIRGRRHTYRRMALAGSRR